MSIPSKGSPYYQMAIKLAISALIIFFVLGLYFFYISPRLGTQETQIDEMENAKVQIRQLQGEVIGLGDEVARLRVKYQGIEGRFFEGSEIIQMNSSINKFAMEAKVQLLSMQLGKKEKLVREAQVGRRQAPAGGFQAGRPQAHVGAGDEFFRIPIDFKIKGSYLNYLTFRSRLARWPKSLHIERESIKAGRGRYKGIVTVTGVLRVIQQATAKKES